MISCHTRTALLVGITTVVFGCDSSGPDLTGSWSGTIERTCGPSLTLSLVESAAGVISGSANLLSPPSCGFGSVNYTVSGEHDHPQVVLVFEPLPGQYAGARFELSGAVSGADSITGAVEGDAITLVRQPSP